MVIVYPFNNRLMLGRAHDILVVRDCYHMASAGAQVYLLVGRSGAEDEILSYYGFSPHPNLKIVQLPLLRRTEGRFGVSWHGVFNLSCLIQISRLSRSLPIDIIYISEIKLADFLLGLRRLIRAKFVYDVHGLYARGAYSGPFRADKREMRVFKRADGLITTTQSLQDIIGKNYGIDKHVALIPLAARLPRAEHSEVMKNCSTIFYFGQLYYLQGVDLLIDAMRFLPEGELHIIGGTPQEIENLKRYSATKGVGERVVFHGFLRPADVYARAAGAGVLVLPCRGEGKMPFVAHTKLYEYMALGRPIVASDLPSIREEIRHGENGILVQPNDPQALAQGIRMVLENRDLAEKVAFRARQDISKLTWDGRAEAIISFLRELLNGKGQVTSGRLSG